MDKDTFTKKLKKCQLLSGAREIEEQQRDALWDELKGERDNEILLALKDVAHSGDYINIANINKHLWKHKSERLEKEAIKEKKARERAASDLQDLEMPDEARDALKKLFGKNWLKEG
jgi:RNA polymerase-interacting CarD/CdnL/TRCF family regulator